LRDKSRLPIDKVGQSRCITDRGRTAENVKQTHDLAVP
jgi:hypothetical protein